MINVASRENNYFGVENVRRILCRTSEASTWMCLKLCLMTNSVYHDICSRKVTFSFSFCFLKNNTLLLVDIEFLFSGWTRHFTRSPRLLLTYRVEHSKRNSTSTRLCTIRYITFIWILVLFYFQSVWLCFRHRLTL